MSALSTSFRRSLQTTLDFFDTKFLETGGKPPLQLAPIKPRTRNFEWLIILAAVTLYCLPFLDLGTLNRMPGNESEVIQVLDQILNMSVRQYGHFPLWNPYINAGLPYVEDAVLHAYNPFISVPVLLFGQLNGFKIAVYLGFLIAAYGMWFLGRVLGLGTPGRLWLALVFAFAGATMQRLFQGQYPLMLSAAWIPCALGCVYAALATRRRLHLAAAALALALLFTCGHFYHAYYILYAIALMVIVFCANQVRQERRIQAASAPLKIALTIGVLAFGLIAIQFLPLTEFRPRLSKAINLELTDSQTPRQILLDFTSADPRRADAIVSLPPEEFYAYIGWLPFAALALLPFAWRPGQRQGIVFLVLLLALTVVWIDIRDMPWKELYRQVPFLYQWRYPTRFIIFGTLSLVGLSGISLDSGISRARSVAQNSQGGVTRALGVGARYALPVFMAVALVQIATTNRRGIGTQKYYAPPYEVLGWLSQYDRGIYYISAPSGWHNAALANQLRYLDAWYHYNDIRRFDGMVNKHNVQAGPKYKVLGNDAGAPAGSTLVHKFDGFSIYSLPDSLPFAFSVSTGDLATPSSDGANLQRTSVGPLDPYTPDMNRIELIADGSADRMLVLLSALAPGWTLRVDEHEAPILNVSGYMAADLLPGAHRYLFSYHPISFTAGLIITLIFLALVLAIMRTDVARVGTPEEGWRALPERARRWWRGGIASSLGRRAGIETAGATYADELLKLDRPLSLEDGARVTVTIAPAGASVWDHWLQASGRVADSWMGKVTWAGVLFTVALGVYLFTGLYRLSDFPIYFFGDEAIQTTSAEALVRNGFKGPAQDLLPTYFVNGSYYNLGTSVYVQVLPYLMFGKSIEVTRGAAFLMTVLAATALALLLRNVFKSRHWWIAPLLLGIAPAWFLHSRTAFETALFGSFFAIFLYLYLMYRQGSPAYIYAALVAAGLAFYSYSPGQVVMGITGLSLLLIDARYHWHNRRVLLPALGLGLALAVPYLRFRSTHSFTPEEHLRVLSSYWVDAIPVSQKLVRFVQEYLYGLSPWYWFVPNNHDLVRHIMKGYGHLLLGTFPFFAAGVVVAVKRVRQAPYRTVLIALLASPTGAALADIGVTRELVFVIPAALLTSLGLLWFLEWISGWLTARYATAAAAIRSALPALALVALVSLRVGMTGDALRNGPTWYKDYGLYGMQYGARQVFQDTIRPALAVAGPHYFVSPNWANGTTNLTQFFFTADQQQRVQLVGTGTYIANKLAFSPNDVFVLMPEDYGYIKNSGRFKEISVQQVLKYPNGQPGFYFVNLAYVDNIDQLLAQAEAQLQQPVQAEITVQGHAASIAYSQIEAGQPKDIFDGDYYSLVRGIEANPFIVDLSFHDPFRMTGMSAEFGHMKVVVKAELYVQGREAPLHFEAQDLATVGEPHIEMNFAGGPYDVTRVRVQILDLDVADGAPAKIHVRGLEFH